MTPEILYDLSFDEYRKMDGINMSTLKTIRKSPLHMKYWSENRKGDSRAVVLGRAAHTLLWEKEKFAAEYIVHPKFDMRKSEHKLLKLQYEGTGRTLLDEEEMATVSAMTSSVLKNERARALIDNTKRELTCKWQDKESMLRCKARLDCWNEEILAIVDLKTTRDASRSGFERAIWERGYHLQGAFYLDALRACGLNPQHFILIAVENEAPFGVQVFRLRNDVIELAQKEVRQLLSRYRECYQANDWPGYPSEIQDIGVPAYGLKQMEIANGND